METLLISTYDLGRQPFGLASAAAALRAADIEISLADLSRERLSADAVTRADAVAFFLPMHTATRLALPVIDRVRELNPRARLCAYGLYAPLNAALLRGRGVTTVIGGEFEDALVAFVRGEQPPENGLLVPRVAFRVPERRGLPVLSRYATLQVGRERRVVAYTEASRGCKHRCRHCPVVPVYDGRFRIVPVDVVLADIRAQIDAGARHVTFGDPDFFNGIKHAAAVVDGLAREFPAVSYDVTIKVEHLLAHAAMLPVLRDTGCAFVTSAVESVDDEILDRLKKGHTRDDFERVADLFCQTGLQLQPTFVPFTPWTTLEGYCDLLQTIDRLGLVDQVAPIQLAIRLLITEGSRLLELDEIRTAAPRFDAGSLTYLWQHRDPRVDVLQEDLMALIGTSLTCGRREMFASVWTAAHRAAELTVPPRRDVLARAAVPYLNEPWYC
jgi:radical SAM superfamily enzyme YgiQ (UPF0313 family)